LDREGDDMGLKIFFKQLLHTPDNNPLEMVESPNPGVYRPAVKVPDIEEVFGAINETKVTDPDAAEASALGLLRGLLAAIQAQAGGADLADLVALLTAINQKDIANQTTAAAVLAALQGVLNVNVNGSLVANETNKAVMANTNILAADYTADGNKSSLLMVLTDTSSVLSLLVDGVSGTLNSGIALDAGKWYAFEIPITYQSTYNLQSSVSATMQIKWVVM